jgi:hypothetical protein
MATDAAQAVVRALDGWAGAKRGRSHETGLRADSGLWSATAWENGTELAVSIEKTPALARAALLVDLQKATKP